jgi:DNA-binding NarL/FixJ family response regulator
MIEIRLVVIDDHPLFRAGVTHTFLTEPDLKVVGQGCSASEALDLAERSCPDIILLGMNIPGGGVSAVQQLKSCNPDVKPLILSGIADADQVRSAMQKGAWGYVLKGVSGTELIRAVRVVHGGERYVTPALAARLFAAPAAPARLASDAFASLTTREEQVLALIVQGLSNKEIGGQLELSEKTVKHYLTLILDKLQVRTRVQAALLAYGRSNPVPRIRQSEQLDGVQATSF